MERVSVSGLGRHIEEKHTHYELHVHIGPYPATVEIPAYVAVAFQKRYGQPITKADRLTFTAEFLHESDLVPECRNPFQSGEHRKIVITSLDEIVVAK